MPKKKTKKKQEKESFVIPKKAMLGIAPAIGILAILFAKNKSPEALLFILGIFAGIMIGKGFFEK